MAEVTLDNVTKVYPGGVVAVKDATLRIADKEFVVLVGPSGCGKSTTIRMVAGLEEITEGTIRIGERVVNDVPPKDRDIAMVFQNYALYPHMTVYKNMAFGLKLRRYPKSEIDQRVQRAARMLGIGDLLDRKPKALSGGQRQRVAVGRAIVREPKAFLFDEPLSNLDAKLRVEMRVELKKLHTQVATTTIYVTHDQEEAMTLGDRVVVMKDGLLQQVARPLDIYEFPVNGFVAGFLGTPPMNFLRCVLNARDGRLVLTEENAPKQLAVEVPKRIVEQIRPHADNTVFLGMRPRNMNEEPIGKYDYPGGANALHVKVSVVEPLGHELEMRCQTPSGTELRCILDAHSRIRPNDEVKIFLDMNQIHLFDLTTEQIEEGGVEQTKEVPGVNISLEQKKMELVGAQV
jgi:multiple sugar transport system ATP-binding protein